MELIRISDRKLKIMLTPSDMRHFELNSSTFGEDSTQMHHAFRLLLAEIQRQTDFEADDRQISVQYFPSREGGCEMFISRLCECEEPGKESPRLPALQKHPAGFHREAAYRFDCLQTLLEVCQRLLRIHYIGKSDALWDAHGGYHLILSFLSHTPFGTPEELCFLVEYGKLENASQVRRYLSEHGGLICRGNAVEVLGELR